MQVIETTIFKCDFCKKIYLRSFDCKRHEERCAKNPINHRPCFNCGNLKQVDCEYEVGDNYYTGEPEYRPSKTFFCKERKLYFKHPKTRFLQNFSDWVLVNNEETEQKEMPTVCYLV